MSELQLVKNTAHGDLVIREVEFDGGSTTEYHRQDGTAYAVDFDEEGYQSDPYDIENQFEELVGDAVEKTFEPPQQPAWKAALEKADSDARDREAAEAQKTIRGREKVHGFHQQALEIIRNGGGKWERTFVQVFLFAPLAGSMIHDQHDKLNHVYFYNLSPSMEETGLEGIWIDVPMVKVRFKRTQLEKYLSR